MPDPKAKRPLTQQEKDRASYLHTQGIDPKEIARELNVDARKISGYIRSQINFNQLQDPAKNPAAHPAPPPPSDSSETPMPNPPQVMPNEMVQPPLPFAAPPGQAQPAYAAPPAPQYQQPAYAPAAAPAAVAPQQAAQPASPDGWVGGRPVSGHSDGFTNQAQQLRTVVERAAADGQYDVMGEHFGPMTREQIADIYGQGVYKVLRYEPGMNNVPKEFKFRVSDAYGPARTPKRSSMADASGASRPIGGRPWQSSFRPAAPAEEDDGRPPARPYSPIYNRPDPSLSDFARHGSAGGDASATAASEAIKAMGRMNEQMVAEVAKTREHGPESVITNFFQQQQTLWERKQEEDSKRRDEDRREEQLRFERQQKAMAEEARLRQAEADKAHQRELERIRLETDARERQQERQQKALIDLEQQRAEIQKKDHENRMELFREELKRGRQEIQETRDAVASTIAESDKRMTERFEAQEAALDREHKLKEKNLENAEKLQNEIISLKRDAIQNAGGDQLFQTINTVIKEFSKGLEKIVDLKKVEALTPEAQAAAVAKGAIDGNFMGEPRRQQAQQQPEVQAGAHNQQQAAAQAASAAQQNKEGAAASAGAAPETEKAKEQEMEQIIQAELDKPFFKQVLKEWSLHIKRGEPPFTFANMYMEWMRDPLDHEGRKATTMFANFMTPRSWEDMMKIIGPKLDKETLAIFNSEAAEEYYNGFRTMVVEQIREYWENFLSNRKAQRAAQVAAGESAAQVPGELSGQGEKK